MRTARNSVAVGLHAEITIAPMVVTVFTSGPLAGRSLAYLAEITLRSVMALLIGHANIYGTTEAV